MDDHLQGEPTAGQQINLGLIASAVQKHTSVADFLRNQPHPWCDRKPRPACQVVHDLSRPERHVPKLAVPFAPGPGTPVPCR